MKLKKVSTIVVVYWPFFSYRFRIVFLSSRYKKKKPKEEFTSDMEKTKKLKLFQRICNFVPHEILINNEQYYVATSKKYADSVIKDIRVNGLLTSKSRQSFHNYAHRKYQYFLIIYLPFRLEEPYNVNEHLIDNNLNNNGNSTDEVFERLGYCIP